MVYPFDFHVHHTEILTGVLVQVYPSISAAAVDFHGRDDSPRPTHVLDSRKVANVVIARDLNQACRNVQIQALEVIEAIPYQIIHVEMLKYSSSCAHDASFHGQPCTQHQNTSSS